MNYSFFICDPGLFMYAKSPLWTIPSLYCDPGLFMYAKSPLWTIPSLYCDPGLFMCPRYISPSQELYNKEKAGIIKYKHYFN